MRKQNRKEGPLDTAGSQNGGVRVRKPWLRALFIAGGLAVCTAVLFAFYKLPLNASEIVIVVAFWFLAITAVQFLRRGRRRRSTDSAILLTFSLFCSHRGSAVTSPSQTVDAQSATSDVIACSASEFLAQRGDRVELYAYAAKSLSSSAFVWEVQAGALKQSSGTLVGWTLSGLNAAAATVTASVSVHDPSIPPAQCSVDVAILPDTVVSRGAANTGRAMISQNDAEEQGFPLYSYLLFGRRPLGEERVLCLTAIEAVLSYAEDITTLRRYFKVDQLDVAALFVSQRVPTEVSRLSSEEVAEWILDHYDFVRAQSILARIGDTRRELIYLVTSSSPLGVVRDNNPSADAVVQRLEGVPDAILAGVIRRFLNQAVRADRPKADQIFSLMLRARILIAQAGATTPELTKAANSIVSLIRK